MKYLIMALISSTLLMAQTYELSESKVTFKLPYTLGTHEGETTKLQGKLNLDEGTGFISFQVETLKTGNEEMDCHMYESLILDYSQSDFPDDHICEDDKIPSSIKGQSYKEVRLVVKSVSDLKKEEGKITGRISTSLEIHGQKEQVEISFEAIKKGKSWVTNNSLDISLKKYKVKVKPFLFIKVEDQVSVKLDLTWNEVEL